MTHLISTAPDVWTLPQPQKLPGGLNLPTRMTLVRGPEAAGRPLWIHSPGLVDEDTVAEINALGTVQYLVAPNCMHHMYLRKAQRHWPEAQVFLAPGLKQKRPVLEGETLSPEVSWSSWMRPLPIEGMPVLNEHLFYHEATRSLIVTDFLFNNQSSEGWITGMYLRLSGTYRGLRQSRVWRWFSKDKAALRESVHALYALPIERIIPCHGEVFEASAEACQVALRDALGWLDKGTVSAAPRPV